MKRLHRRVQHRRVRQRKIQPKQQHQPLRPVPVPQTKEQALAELALRKEANKTRVRVDNASLVAGSPMYFDCLQCQGEIVVPEDYVTRPYLCTKCQPQ